MSAADRAVALGQANERLQYVVFACLLIGATIWFSRYALLWRAQRRKQELRVAQQAEAARRARIAQTELCRQRIKFLHGRTIYLPGNTGIATSTRREKAAMN